MCLVVFFFNDTATTEIYTLSLHDALPISPVVRVLCTSSEARSSRRSSASAPPPARATEGVSVYRFGASQLSKRTRRSEEHTSELQSRQYLVCRLLLEKLTCTP